MTADIQDRSTATLDSWKAIARYLHRDVRTVQRWERDEGLPVHRHEHQQRASVYAYPQEIDAWRKLRSEKSKQRPARRSLLLAFAAVGVAVVTIAWWWSDTADDEPQQSKLVVVVPFDQIGEERSDPLADALTDEITVRLAASDPQKLAVIARSSAKNLTQGGTTAKELRDLLNADYAVDGTILRTGNQVRITAQLVDTRDQVQLWADQFEYPDDGWDRTSELASFAILNGIAGELGLGQLELHAGGRATPMAREHVLLGWHYFDQFRPDLLADAMRHFTTANEIDSEFAGAQVGLGMTNAAGVFFRVLGPKEGYEAAKYWAASALELDPTSGEAVSLLGWVDFAYHWSWQEAERKLQEGVRRQPNSPWTNWMYANYLSAMKRHEEAVAIIDTAMRIDPASPMVLISRGYILANAGRFDAAVRHYNAARGQLGGQVDGWLLETYEMAGEYDHAVKILERLDEETSMLIRDALAADGADGYWAARLRSRGARLAAYPHMFSYQYAVAASQAGEIDAALDMLERGYHQRDPTMAYLLVYSLENLHDDPRFLELLTKMQLPAPAPL